ncbi:DUF6907 domain-containing protein [Streptomyces sp. NBC_00448]|uniref:DUF6907 domain-containing protein n=1 Tax=Streptomyces sp. NBC_00448 TaxID=2903652 RepID=UPI002E24118D
MTDRSPAPSAPSELRTDSGSRRWTLTTTDGHTLRGYLPPWAGVDPSEDDVPPSQLADVLTDIHHSRSFTGQTASVYTATGRASGPVEQEILSSTLDCTPNVEPPQPQMPVVNVHLCEESWITDLDPDGVAGVAAMLRAQADHLENEVRPALVAARRDWTSHHWWRWPKAAAQ